MSSRRPTSIPAMLLHLARLYPRHAAGVVAVAAGVVVTVGLASSSVSSSTSVERVGAVATTASQATASQTTASRTVLGVGVCSTRPVLCVSDATCGAGARCVDPHDLRGLVLRHRSPGVRDDGIPVFPSMVWAGEGYGLAWSGLSDEGTEVWFARASAAGQRLGAPLRVTRSPSQKVFPVVVASPAGYLVAWTDLRDDGDVSVWMQRLDRGGATQGQPVRIPQEAGLSFLPRAVWNGREYAVVWYHLASQRDFSLRLARFTPDGARVGADSTISTQILPTGAPGFAWMGDGYGVAWSTLAPRGGEGQTLLAGVGVGGDAAPPFRITGVRGQNGAVALAWAKGHFGAVWEDDITLDDEDDLLGRLAFAGVTPSALVVPRRELTPRDALYSQPSLVWTGTQYGFTWARVGDNGADVFFRRLDDKGQGVGAPLKFTAGALGLFPTLAWSGTEFAVAWTHLGARGFQLRLGRIDGNGRRVGGDTVIVDG